MFSCCFWWFLLGLLIGWLLNWLLRSLFNNDNNNGGGTANTVYTPPPAKPVATAAPVAATPQAAVAPAPKVYVLDKAAALAAGFKLSSADDLTVIEGIGPKINELFINAGFKTFEQVSKMKVEQMQKILDDAGPRYKLAKPGTWAQQAALCAENKWSELKVLQDRLNKGV